MRAQRLAVGHGVEEVELLDDLAVLPADVVPVRPPGADVGMVALGDRDLA